MNLLERKRLASVPALLMLLCVVANAYTLVLRDGRQMTIPDTFQVSTSTITYEAGPNIQVTVQLVGIDIAATERANNETSGTFMRRIVSKSVTAPTRNERTVTNLDLEKFRQTRLASESAYEKRRRELGLPSVEESRRAAMASGERAQEQLLSTQSKEQESESYWRSRASELRVEMLATDERIRFITGKLNELPLSSSFTTYGPIFTSVSPVFRGQLGSGPQSFGVVDQLARGAVIQPRVFQNRGATFGASIGFGNGVRGRVFFNSFPQAGFGRRHFNSSWVGASSIYSFDDAYERAALSSELNQLQSNKIGLQARWRALEEEARRTGAYPGWLR